ncbi:ribosome rescue protein RqcH [Methanolobus bombayensis]|uniref:ribosome rescue protein RqcH n=1 Tax=Methanolobus bombayensis TaxID=38023 RepID=UPI001AE8020C|nr:ribosome rescue protein RqcH [Methanolobus bombayensis]MBP1909845.1 putative ribosome quality control (RQC) complex YloA/Tae2 family protein [Methanolobus bombayensis]
MKKEMTSADVAALALELSSGDTSIIDAKIAKIYQPADDEIRINLYIYDKGRDNLVIEAGKRAHMSRHIRPSPKIPQSFPMMLRKHIMAGRITFVKQYDFDRILEIGVVRGGVETVLVVELFSPGNIVLLDSERKIILPMKPVTFKGRRIRSGEVYQYPGAQISPVDATVSDLEAIFSGSDADVVRTIATRFNLGGVLAEEVCARSGVDKSQPAKETDSDDTLAIIDALKEVFAPLLSGNLKPCVVKKEINDEMKAFDALPFELSIYKDYEKESLPSFNAVLDEFFGKAVTESVQQQVTAVKKEKVDVFARRLQKQEEAIKKFTKDADKQTRIAEVIYANYVEIEEIVNVLKQARDSGYSWSEIKSIVKKAKDTVPAAKWIENINSAEGTIVLNLDGTRANIDIKLTIPQNAQIYYDKAKKLAKKKDGALKAIEDTKLAMQKKEKKISSRRKVNTKKYWYERFRWFTSSDGFLVVAGRDADSNEEIVKKYMEKRDIVFHTQDPGAPITLIKTLGKDIPEQTLHETAQFVVSYSSVWKSGQFSGDCYWIKPEQVSKTPETGEYLKKGSFVIRGERNYFRDVQVNAAIGLELEGNTRVIGGPGSAVRKHGQHVVEVVPGKYNQNDIAKKIYKLYVEKLKEPNFVKQIASPDKIAMMLPPGESDIKV